MLEWRRVGPITPWGVEWGNVERRFLGQGFGRVLGVCCFAQHTQRACMSCVDNIVRCARACCCIDRPNGASAACVAQANAGGCVKLGAGVAARARASLLHQLTSFLRGDPRPTSFACFHTHNPVSDGFRKLWVASRQPMRACPGGRQRAASHKAERIHGPAAALACAQVEG